MATLIGQVSLGAEASIWPGAVLRADDGPIIIGELTSIQDGSVVHMTEGWSTVTVGKRVTVGHNVTLHGCEVEDDCLIGMGAVILDRAVIGRGSVIGASTLIPVGKVIPPGSLVFGNPFRIVRPCGEKELAMIEQGWKAYQRRAKEYLRARAG
jgi:carbonic anhydrase/acetyltransferase-like protein (isoleucine patch superfamily)